MTDLMGRGPLGQKTGKTSKPKKGMRKVSAKKAAYRASNEGQEALEYMGKVKRLPCCICGSPAPNDAHHCFHDRYGMRRASDFDVIPLCKSCHQDGPNAIHNIKATWRERHGPDYSYIEQTRDRVRSLLR